MSETDTVPTVTVASGSYLVNGKEVVAASQNVVFGGISGTTESTWCIDITNPLGDVSANPGFLYYRCGRTLALASVHSVAQPDAGSAP